MGKFAQSAAQHDTDRRGDGTCVAGKWIIDNFDDEDLTEFVRLAKSHKWTLIEQLSGNALKEASMSRHVHSSCICIGDTLGKGCCTCDREAEAY